MSRNDAKESARLRKQRIDGSQNGATLRTRIVRDKTKYSRNVKHKKSLADARDFAFLARACDYWTPDSSPLTAYVRRSPASLVMMATPATKLSHFFGNSNTRRLTVLFVKYIVKGATKLSCEQTTFTRLAVA